MLKPPTDAKESVRTTHALQRKERIKDETTFLRTNSAKLIDYFADGTDVDPARISPRLQIIRSDSVESDLFRFASLTWSVPVSRGYGRRIRYLVWDAHTDKLMGLIALGDPVFNLKVRDDWIGWSLDQRKEHLVSLMDAYVLGAIPPYNMLLGGKLIATLIRTKETRAEFAKKYGSTTGIISGRCKHASLALVTTTSALGRSSVYNRLKLDGVQYFEPIGFTSGWGHFHIPDDLFEDMRSLLKANGHQYAANHQYGDGPNWRLRTIRTALSQLGVDENILRHGISREVFISSLASNAKRYLTGQSSRPVCRDLLSRAEVVELARQRWLLPRAHRRKEYRRWRKSGILALLRNSGNLRQHRRGGSTH